MVSAVSEDRSVERRPGGYYQNFENYRKGTEGSEARISAHFSATHREPEPAAESFKLMLREAPRLALWAANNHPIAFGEPTGAAGAGLQASDVRAAFRAAERQAGRTDPAPTRADDPILAGERNRMREASSRARMQGRGERHMPTVARSIERVANRVEADAVSDADAWKRAALIREIARNPAARRLGDHDTPTAPDRGRLTGETDQPTRLTTPSLEKAKRYKQLEDELRRRDAARRERKTRDRGGDERKR